MKILTLGSSSCKHTMVRAEAFLAAGCENTVLNTIPNKNLKNKFETKIMNPFFDLSGIGAWERIYNFFKNLFILRGLLRKLSYDIIHVYYPTNYLSWAVYFWTKKPVVLILMGGDVLFEQQKVLSIFYKKIIIKCLKLAHLNVAKSPYIQKRIASYGVNSLKVINCIFGIMPGFVETKLSKTTTDPFVFLCMRPFNVFYQYEKLLEIFYFLKINKFDAHLKISLFYPHHDYLNRIKQKIEKFSLLEQVELIPAVSKEEDLINLYDSAHFVIALPESDGIPQSALEGMARGCVNILPDNEVYSGIFNQQNTILLSGSSEKMANQIMNVVRNKQLSEFQKNGLQLVLTKGLLPANIKKIINLTKTLTFHQKRWYINRVILLFLFFIYTLEELVILGVKNRLVKILR